MRTYWGILLIALTVFSCKDKPAEANQTGTVSEETASPEPNFAYGFNLDEFRVVADTVRSGDIFGELMMENKVAYPKIHALTEHYKDTFDVRRFRVGKPYYILKSRDTSEVAQVFIYQEDPVNYTVVDFRDSVLVTVTSDPDDVASVVIEGDNSNMEIGESRQLSSIVRTAAGDVVETDVTWSTSDASVLSVDASGQVTAEAEGSASITAMAEDILSEPFTIEVGTSVESRSGEFSGRNGYNASGTATLEASGDEAVLKFSSDFVTQNGPGLYIYLSTKDNSVQGALELGKIQSTSGAQEYELPAGSDPSPYDHVIIYCKPFGVLFGVASFE